MGSMRSWITAVGLGAGLMYILDPQHGPRRRAQVRDQIGDLRRAATEMTHSARSLRNRAGDVILGTRQVASGQKDWRDVVPIRGETSVSVEKLTGRMQPINPRSLAIVGSGLMLLSSVSRRSRAATAGRWLGIGLLAGSMMKARSADGHNGHASASADEWETHSDEIERARVYDCGQVGCED